MKILIKILIPGNVVTLLAREGKDSGSYYVRDYRNDFGEFEAVDLAEAVHEFCKRLKLDSSAIETFLKLAESAEKIAFP